MSDLRVTVSLHPLTHHDFLTRTFTLSADNRVFSIGRSSERSLRKRTPEANNGWFDSRVMSRDHAQFTLCLEKNILYICDTGSTHGTWLNNIRLIDGEKTPLISGDVLRFGVTVDRGDEEFPALAVTCKIDWTAATGWPTPPNPPAIELEAPVESEIHLMMRPPCSTNTFCVPDDSDIEEMQSPPMKYADEAAAVFHQAAIQASQDPVVDDDSVIELEKNELDSLPALSDPNESDVASSESGEKDSDLESSDPASDPSSFSHTNNNNETKPNDRELIDYSEDEAKPNDRELIDYSEDEAKASDPRSLIDYSAEEDSEAELGWSSDPESDIAVESLVDAHDGFINPDLLTQNHNSGAYAFDKVPVDTEATESKLNHPREVHVEVCTSERRPHPHSVVPQDEGQSALLGFQSALKSAPPATYGDGPFSCTYIDSEGASSSNPVSNSTASSLKRKACELELQDAQVVESVLPVTQDNLDSIPQPDLVDAISSALSETSVREPPKKRVKSSHPSSGTVASYTATAVISALLGGLGTIALLAALPAEYFQ